MIGLKLNGMKSSLDKSTNIYTHLVEREYFTKKSHRRSHQILGTIITKCKYTLKKVWSQTSNQRISCDGSLVFFKNYSQCYDCSASYPYQRFQIKKVSPAKIEDAMLLEGTPETVELPHKGYKNCMLALTKDNRLLRAELAKGEVLEEVYISSPTITYRTIQWNSVGESVTLISTLFPKERVLQNREVDPNKVKQLVVLSIFPLKFVCKLTISKQVFGRYAADVSIFLDLVTVMYSSGHVRMYSLEWILSKHKFHNQQMYEPLSDGSKFGVYPSCLTENVEITELPPCLFEVRCRNRDVMLTLPPCYYIMWPHKEETGYCCFSFETQQMVEGGCLSKPSEISTFEDRVALHADDSGRIVHMTNSQLRLLKLQQDDVRGATKLIEDFTITRNIEPKQPSLKVSRSGRILKQRVLSDSVDLSERTVLTMVYSEEQEMIVLLSLQHVDCATIGFYDNWSGQLLCQFALEEPVEETVERSLSFYLDTVVHVFKTEQGQFECHVYKMQAIPD